MEPASTLPTLSSGKNWRDGQVRVFDAITPQTSALNIKLPTGYGKTLTMCGVFAMLKKQARINRKLVIFPSLSQLDQFKSDGKTDLSDVGIGGPLDVIDLSFFGANAVKRHRLNTAQIFVTSVQALRERRGMDNTSELLSTGQWMIVVDEYHHYGIDKSWGQSVLALQRAFFLAMSATPYRATEDSAFGPPDVSVSYREAVRQKAVKELRGHAYEYRIDAVTDDGEVTTLTTSELVAQAGGEGADRIEKLRIKNKMRWSPKYISPLLYKPIERMQRERAETGHPKLQVLIGALCVSHAQMVFRQVSETFPELKFDWVGTGEFGREPAENAAALKKFCPPKDANGNRPEPELDGLVHVGIAGEGLDCTRVSEVIDLNSGSFCNKRNQEHGRAARYLPDVIGNINFDSSSDYAAYAGAAIMDAMDDEAPKIKPYEPPDEPNLDDEVKEFPDEPYIRILNAELLHIDSGQPDVQMFAKAMQAANIKDPALDYGPMLHGNQGQPDLTHPGWPKVEDAYRVFRSREAAKWEAESEVLQWQAAVNGIVSGVAGRVIRVMLKNGARFEKSLPGDIKKRINTKKKELLGAVEPDVDTCRRHYRWLRELEQEIVARGLPTWLS